MGIKSGLNHDQMGEVQQIVVYIISTHYGTYYTGITNNLLRRWKEHNQGKSSYLRRFKPKEVVYIEFYNDRSVAAFNERRVKRMGAKRFINRKLFRE